MKQEFSSTTERSIGYGSAYVVNSRSTDHLVGRLLTIVESLGLPDKQEKATKDLLRSEVYGSIEHATWINDNLHNIIKDFTIWFEDQNLPCEGGSYITTPENNREGEYTLVFSRK